MTQSQILGARRAQRILRAAARRPMSSAELEREIRKGEPAIREQAAQALRVRIEIRRLVQQGQLVATPAGWSADPLRGAAR